MVTDDSPLGRFLSRTEPSEYEPNDFAPGDTTRLSMESFVASTSGTARDLGSSGRLRLHGAGVEGTSADLADVGRIATSWQKAISAVGATLEDIKSIRGGLPQDVVRRTALVLNASPSPGSVVLNIMPKSNPLPEVEPGGEARMFDIPRPLADRASEQLIELLGTVAHASLDSLDGLSVTMMELGPRVGGSLSALGAALEKANITLDAIWREPDHPTVRAEVTPSEARWIQDFVAGRDLDAEEEKLIGTLVTISNAERWLVEIDEKRRHMDATEVTPEMAGSLHVGQLVELLVRTAFREQPDGVTRKSHRILSVRPTDGQASENAPRPSPRAR